MQWNKIRRQHEPSTQPLSTPLQHNTSVQWKRLPPTVKMFPSGGATTMIFIVDGADAVISFVMRSKACWNMFVPLDNTSLGVQFLADKAARPGPRRPRPPLSQLGRPRCGRRSKPSSHSRARNLTRRARRAIEVAREKKVFLSESGAREGPEPASARQTRHMRQPAGRNPHLPQAHQPCDADTQICVEGHKRRRRR